MDASLKKTAEENEGRKIFFPFCVRLVSSHQMHLRDYIVVIVIRLRVKWLAPCNFDMLSFRIGPLFKLENQWRVSEGRCGLNFLLERLQQSVHGR